MRTFILSAVILTSDDAPITPWSDRLVEAELHNLAAKWLPGQGIVSDVILSEVLPEITTINGEPIRYEAPADAKLADQAEVIALAEALAPVGWDTVEAPLTEGSPDPWSAASL
jgi:hypothetical protein